MRGLLLESGNDAAMTLAEGVSGSTKAFVREMNRRARKLGLKHTHYDNPIGLDGEGNYSSARDLGDARHRPAHQHVLQEDRGLAVGHAEDRRPPAHVHATATRSSASTRSSTASRPATPAAPATCSSAAPAATASSSSAPSLATPSEAARDADTMALYNWAFPRFQRIRAVIEGRPMATAQIRYPRRRRAQARPRPHDPPDRPARPSRRGQPQGRRPERRRGADPQRPAARARSRSARAASSSPRSR